MTNKYSELTYIVNGREGYSLTDALRLWKTKYESDFRDFVKAVTPHESLFDFRDFVESVWEEIIPVTVEEALKLPNTEDRRTYFDAIGIEKLFKQLKPTLLDKKVIKKKRARWDDSNVQYEYKFEDVYELYQIEGKLLFEKDRWGNDPQPVYAVRCWCTTTNREYWIYVNSQAATGLSWRNDYATVEFDAIRAIAWTVRIDVSNPERIYRQGDIIVTKLSEQSQDLLSPRHLTKDEYLSLMYSET